MVEAGVLSVYISYETKFLRAVALSPKSARKLLGRQNSALLRSRLADIRAADRATDVPAGRPRFERNATGSEHFAIDVASGTVLHFAQNHDPAPLNALGNVDWTSVTSLRLLEVIVNGQRYQ